MILDNETLFADNLDVTAATTVLDTEITSPGPGEEINIFAVADSTVTGITGLTLEHSADNSTFSTLLSWSGDLAGALVVLQVPSTAKRYLRLSLAGTVAGGNWTAGISMKGIQLAQ